METPGEHEHILQLSVGHNSETTLQNVYVNEMLFLLLWTVLPSTGLAVHFLMVLCMTLLCSVVSYQ